MKRIYLLILALSVLAAAPAPSWRYGLCWALEAAAFCAVDCYAMISGYVGTGKTFRPSGIVLLWLRVVFYTLLITTVALVAAPLSVARELADILYGRKDSAILCSATLRVGSDFRYMARRLGAEERFRFLTATSPFDYFRQTLVLAPDREQINKAMIQLTARCLSEHEDRETVEKIADNIVENLVENL